MLCIVDPLLREVLLISLQSKPLIPLQTEFDQAQEKRFLTCYMFPQRSLSDIEAGMYFAGIHLFFAPKPSKTPGILSLIPLKPYKVIFLYISLFNLMPHSIYILISFSPIL